MNGRTDTVRLLLDHGADPLIADAQGRTIADYVSEAGHDETSELLRAGAT